MSRSHSKIKKSRVNYGLFSFFFCFRLKRMVSNYIQDTDPDASLSVGADMRKINMCFSLLKVPVNQKQTKLIFHKKWLYDIFFYYLLTLFIDKQNYSKMNET